MLDNNPFPAYHRVCGQQHEFRVLSCFAFSLPCLSLVLLSGYFHKTFHFMVLPILLVGSHQLTKCESMHNIFVEHDTEMNVDTQTHKT